MQKKTIPVRFAVAFEIYCEKMRQRLWPGQGARDGEAEAPVQAKRSAMRPWKAGLPSVCVNSQPRWARQVLQRTICHRYAGNQVNSLLGSP